MIVPKAILIDARNWEAIKASLLSEIQQTSKVSFDIETEDSHRHEGLNIFMGVEDGKKKSNKPLVFDIKRTTITGFSWYCKGSELGYYLNLNHADVENRISWEEAKQIVDELKKRPVNIIHNASYERIMMKECYGVDLGKNVLCSMQLAVTAFNDDTYDIEEFKNKDLDGIKVLFPKIKRAFKNYDPRNKLNTDQEELLFKVIAKESDAAHSYNGWVKSFSYRFGLKNLSKKFLNYTQTSFDEVLNGKAHMGELTGEEVVQYGADDAWCCMAVADYLMEYIKVHSPEVIPTFLNQENPMTQIYSDVWSNGLRVNTEAIKQAQANERQKAAAILRVLKKGIRALLPFNSEPHEKLKKYDKWYYSERVDPKSGEIKVNKSYERYRQMIIDWANTSDSEDAYTQLQQVRSAISNAWAEEQGLFPSKGVNLNHYMPIRTILFDLCGCSYIQADGKTQSNGEAQKKMKERWTKKHGEVKGDAVILVLNCLDALSTSEQVMKLFVTNYLNLTDPDTGRMYPVLNSLLNTRRMALSFPNVSQLPKEGYVRSFFLPDNEDHLLISCDWSSIELVEIGERSGDKSFKEAFGQLPYADLHAKAAYGCLGLTPEEFYKLPNRKKLRKDVGKGANFNYWYSGALGTVGERLGWTSDVMWEKVDGYRNTFPEAEAWRVGTIAEVRKTGEVELPDHHKRYRFEATNQWKQLMRKKFYKYGKEIGIFGDIVIKKIQSRAGNQAVNAKVQGTCATLAKRTILRMEKIIREKKYEAKFKFPVHDELIYSAHIGKVLSFIKDFRFAMCDHPDLYKNLILDATVAIGKNFGAYHAEKNPYGQIELDEYNGPDTLGIEYSSKLTDFEVQKVVDYLSGNH